MHEKQMHESSCFVTLTYAPEKLPTGGSLVKSHFQKFMKLLRSKRELKKWRESLLISAGGGRYFQCGEYGELTRRPHYHALLFGVEFRDREFYKRNDQGDAIFTSGALSALWPHGFATLADVTFESAAYVARYCLKKLGPQACEDLAVPEYGTMSRRPGLGATWFEKFRGDVYPSDFVVMRGRKMRPPTFYDRQLDSEVLAGLKVQRLRAARAHAADQTRERLVVREEVQQAKVKLFRREL